MAKKGGDSKPKSGGDKKQIQPVSAPKATQQNALPFRSAATQPSPKQDQSKKEDKKKDKDVDAKKTSKAVSIAEAFKKEKNVAQPSVKQEQSKKEEKKDDKKKDKDVDIKKVSKAVSLAETFKKEQKKDRDGSRDLGQARKELPGKRDKDRDQEKNKEKDRVQKLTEKAKNLLSQTNEEGGLADPGKFKDVLSRLKDLGKEGKVKELRSEKEQALATFKQTLSQTPSKQEVPKEEIPEKINEQTKQQLITPENLTKTITDVLATQPKALTQEDLQTAFKSFQQSSTALPASAQEKKPSQEIATTKETAPSWEEGYRADLTNWLNEYKKEQEKRGEEYQQAQTSVSTEEGAFDPDRFRDLLGELESSKRRQKEWNERSARAAYKY